MMKKLFSIFLVFLFCLTNVFSLTIIDSNQNPNNNVANAGASSGSGIADIIAGAVVLGLIVGVVIGLIIWITYMIVKLFRENERKHSDLLYGTFKIQEKLCHENRDPALKFRNWKTSFLSFKRRPIFLRTSQGLKKYGSYHGEMINVLNDASFYLIATNRKTGFFTSVNDIIIIPSEMKDMIVSKEKHEKGMAIILECESIGSAMNTDYFLMPIVRSPKDSSKFVDFNDYLQQKMLEPTTYREVIKDNLLDFKDSVDSAVEMNPNINVGRKNPNQ